MTNARQALGRLGERIAARWMEAHGWRVLERRFRNGRRDIDLVAACDGTVAFVEVKARRGGAFGDPVEAVHWRKRRELVRSALVWMDRHPDPALVYRFDVIGILIDGARVRVRHIEHAFSLADGGVGGSAIEVGSGEGPTEASATASGAPRGRARGRAAVLPTGPPRGPPTGLETGAIGLEIA